MIKAAYSIYEKSQFMRNLLKQFMRNLLKCVVVNDVRLNL